MTKSRISVHTISRPLRFPPWRSGLGISILIAFAVKLGISLSTIGTDDSARWYGFLNHISKFGAVNLYHQTDMFNHPPFMAHMLRIMGALSSITGLPFYFWLRLPAILADIASVMLVYQLLKSQLGPRFSTSTLVLMALAPPSVMISGFHGNTDSLMLSFVLLTIYLIDQKHNVWLAGIAFGMSMNIKVVPIIFLPAILLYLPNNNKRIPFLVSACVTFIVGGLPYIVQDPLIIGTRVFGYGSYYGRWGLSRLLQIFSGSFDILQPLNMAFAKYGKWVMIAVIACESVWMNRFIRKPPLFLQCGLVTVTFLAITPGFGPQYLAWLVPWVCINIGMEINFFSVSGLFLFLIYTSWSKGFPWYFAQSFNYINDVPLVFIELLCWISTLVVLNMYYGIVVSNTANCDIETVQHKNF